MLGAADYILKVSISPEELTEQLKKLKEKLDQKAAEDAKQQRSIQETMLHQERHAAWREFFTNRNYEFDTLLGVTGFVPEEQDTYALCQISFDWYDQNMEPLPSIDLIQSTLKNALEPFDRRRSSSSVQAIPCWYSRNQS